MPSNPSSGNPVAAGSAFGVGGLGHGAGRTSGVTAPACTAQPTEAERRASRVMNEYLVEQGFFEEEKEAIEREKVLGLLNNLVNEFIRKIARRSGVPAEEGSAASKIFTFGSYRLGVHSKGADIDTLCVVPSFISRKDFFSIFYEELSKLKYITSLSKITDTFVPLIKFRIHSIPIDLLFARLDMPSIPDKINLLDNALLKHMDEKCILSLNGSRVTDEILSLVPNVKTFHAALRFVKYWAQKRCVYGHSYGYMGGVAYALCVARACQLYPNAAPFAVVSKFFSLFASWAWPQPVLLKEIVDCNFNLRVWNPKVHPGDRYNKMPVITPAYPSICSTHNVSVSTLAMMKREFARGAPLCSAVLEEGGGDENMKTAVEKLCAPTDFFSRHKNYMMVSIASASEEEFTRFSGFAESKVRLLALKLEAVESISFAFAFPRNFSRDVEDSEVGLARKLFISGLEGGRAYKLRCFFVGLELSSAKLPLNASRKLNLGKPVSEFKEILAAFGDHGAAAAPPEEKEEGGILSEIRPLKQKQLKEVLSHLDKDQALLAPDELANAELAEGPPLKEGTEEGAEERKRKRGPSECPQKKA